MVSPAQERPVIPARPSGKLNGVDALRGLAAILVVTVHVSHTLAGPKDFGHEPFAGLFTFGRAGVDFFFVLSGFVITYVHSDDIGRRAGFGSFWYKRLLRIYPAYWIVTLLFGALLVISPTPDRAERDVVHALSSFFLIPETTEPILGVGWSLRHELLFYALFSVALLQRTVGIALLGAWGAAILFSMLVQCATGTPFFDGIAGVLVFRGFNFEFFFGIATAIILRRRLVWHPGALAAIGAAGFLATGLWESYGVAPMHEWPVRNLAYALSSALTLYGIATLDQARRTYVPALALRLGAASYSIYLTHIPVVLIVEFALRFITPHVPMPVELAFVLVVASGVVAGTIFSEWVEQPILRWGRRAVLSRPLPASRNA
jgi:peptidoglycan/LPS O-acetylase OafA/YrhL